MNITLNPSRITITDSEYRYLDEEALARGISMMALITRVVKTAVKEQMVSAILDDAEDYHPRPGERRHPALAKTVYNDDHHLDVDFSKLMGPRRNDGPPW